MLVYYLRVHRVIPLSICRGSPPLGHEGRPYSFFLVRPPPDTRPEASQRRGCLMKDEVPVAAVRPPLPRTETCACGAPSLKIQNLFDESRCASSLALFFSPSSAPRHSRNSCCSSLTLLRDRPRRVPRCDWRRRPEFKTFGFLRRRASCSPQPDLSRTSNPGFYDTRRLTR